MDAANRPINVFAKTGSTQITANFADAPITPHSKPFSWASFARIAVAISEIAGLMAVEILSAGTATPAVAALGGVAIGLAATGANAIIDATQGSVSLLNVGIGVATSFIPLGGAFVREARAMAALEANIGELEGLATGLSGKAAAKYNKQFYKRLMEQTSRLSGEDQAKAIKLIQQLAFDAETGELETEHSLARILATRFIARKAMTADVAEMTGLTAERATFKTVRGMSQRGTRMMREFIRDSLTDEVTLPWYKELLDKAESINELIESVSNGSFRSTYRNDVNFWLRNEGYITNRIKQIAPEIDDATLMRLTKKSSFKKINILKADKNRNQRALNEVAQYLEERAGTEVYTDTKAAEKIATTNELWDISMTTEDEVAKRKSDVFRLLTQSAGYMDKKVWNVMYEKFLLMLDGKDRVMINLKLMKVFGRQAGKNVDDLGDVIFKAYALDQRRTTVGTVRYLGSKRFNDRWVQKLQAIADPNDFGRMFVEEAYKRSNRWINKKLAFRQTWTTGESNRSIGKVVKSIEKAWLKSGGAVWPQNRYIIGHKIIVNSGVPMGEHLVLIKFNKMNTAARGEFNAVGEHNKAAFGRGGLQMGNKYKRPNIAFRNIGGKRDIMILATDKDLERLMVEGTDYWFAVGHRKGWFVSRGGRRASRGALPVSDKLSLFLGFAQIGAMKNVGSIVTNYVENINSLAKGTYTHTYMKKWLGSFESTLFNRSGRLVARGVLGNLAKTASRDATGVAKFLGQNAPRELQRMMSIFTHSVAGKNARGEFKFGIKSGATIARTAGLGVGASLRSQGMRVAKSDMYVDKLGNVIASPTGRPSRQSSYTSQLNSTGRKFGVIRRIPGTLTPNDVFNPRTFGRVKLK